MCVCMWKYPNSGTYLHYRAHSYHGDMLMMHQDIQYDLKTFHLFCFLASCLLLSGHRFGFSAPLLPEMMCQSHSAINFATSSFGFCVVGFQYISPWAVFMRFTWMQMNERGSFPPTVTSFHIKPVLHHISQCCCSIKSWALKRHLMIVFSVFFLLVQTSCTHEKLTIFFTFRTRLTVHSWTRTIVRYALWVPEHFRTEPHLT